jgi:uncharacterized protein
MSFEERYRRLLIKIIEEKYPDCHIWLFGSRARKTNKPGADIDLAIDARRALTLHEISEIEEAIEDSDLPIFVDLVDIHTVSDDFLDNIKKEWVPWKQ